MPPAIDRASGATWFKSSHSGGNETECVECAHSTDATLVRDSKCTDGPVVRVPAHSWHAFIRALGHDEFGRL
ncbi:DUF397 domain-containing protein [Streptomyces sp. NBC_01236]|uniref:DUF397 domain-containing protein n=1 Tax=Streptomyces sp. NBC_01236 TaxID=2903789 RepID=UPI002E15138F|nr:DUF397 domain-containing protein [Streptomyces sp. NBC_01236]